MKKTKNNYFLVGTSLCILSIFICIFLLKFTKTSFAIETGTFTDGFFENTFTTNNGSNSTVNYINTSFGTDTSYSNYKNAFDVINNYADSNNTNPLYTLMKNLEVPKSTENFEITSEAVQNISDTGITYIINHGYNITNSVNTVFTEKTYSGTLNNSIKQYITQIALWLYIYENKSKFTSNYCKATGAGYDACDFLDNSNSVVSATTVRTIINSASGKSNYGYLKYITDLVDSAKNYEGSEESMIGKITASNNYAYTTDKKKVYLNNISPTITSNLENYMYYAIDVEDPNSYGVYIADNNNNKIVNTTHMNDSFSVVVPLAEDVTTMDLSSVKVKVYAYFLLDNNKSYMVTNSSDEATTGSVNNLMVVYDGTKYDRYSNVTIGYSPYQVIGTQFTLNNFTKISKVDVTNSSELPGASLVVTDKNDSSKTWEWVSTSTPHLIYLENGSYSLCETIAPSGFEKQTECIDFTVVDNKVSAVTMTNAPVSVPNTTKFFNKHIIAIGLSLLFMGFVVVGYFVLIHRKNKIKI